MLHRQFTPFFLSVPVDARMRKGRVSYIYKVIFELPKVRVVGFCPPKFFFAIWARLFAGSGECCRPAGEIRVPERVRDVNVLGEDRAGKEKTTTAYVDFRRWASFIDNGDIRRKGGHLSSGIGGQERSSRSGQADMLIEWPTVRTRQPRFGWQYRTPDRIAWNGVRDLRFWWFSDAEAKTNRHGCIFPFCGLVSLACKSKDLNILVIYKNYGVIFWKMFGKRWKALILMERVA